MRNNSRIKYIIIIAVILCIFLVYFLFPKNTGNQQETTTSVPYKKIIVESITSSGIVTLRLLDQENNIEAGEVKIFNENEEEINIGLCPREQIFPDGKGTCLIDPSKCQSGRGITITGPGTGDEATCP